MAVYTTKAFVDGNWVAPARDELLQLAVTIPKQAIAYVNGDEVRFTKLRPDLDGLGATSMVGAAASDGLVIKYLVLNTIAAGSPLLKQISPYRTITGLTAKNEASYFTSGGSATTVYAFFDKNDVCLATNPSTASPPAGTVKTVQWPALPYLAAVIATAAASGVVAVATANTYPSLGVTLTRKVNTRVDGANIQRYYGYSATDKVAGDPANT